MQVGDEAVERATSTAGSRFGGWAVVLVLGIGYIGVYLCRKNLSVAVPLLQQDFSATKAQVGIIASVGTFAYAAGKLLNGPLVDRVGGRTGFLTALAAVAIFGALGAFSPSLGVLSAVYALNRFAGSAGWGAMVKIVPTWFGVTRSATVLGVMSLSYVLGGVAALLLARQIVTLGGGWRAVMGYPSLVLLLLRWFARSSSAPARFIRPPNARQTAPRSIAGPNSASCSENRSSSLPARSASLSRCCAIHSTTGASIF